MITPPYVDRSGRVRTSIGRASRAGAPSRDRRNWLLDALAPTVARDLGNIAVRAPASRPTWAARSRRRRSASGARRVRPVGPARRRVPWRQRATTNDAATYWRAACPFGSLRSGSPQGGSQEGDLKPLGDFQRYLIEEF